MIRGIHCVIQARPADASTRAMKLGDLDAQLLQISANQQAEALNVSFEEVLADLQQQNCFAEPDGSFVWAGSQDGEVWRLSGQLTDNGERMLFAEIKGECPISVFQEVERILSRGERALMFQLPRQGVFVDRATFLRLANSA